MRGNFLQRPRCDTVKQIDEDDLIYLKVELVEVTAADGWQWRSSLSRHDAGAGACELMLVEDIACLLKINVLFRLRIN